MSADANSAPAVLKSNALHARVRAFALEQIASAEYQDSNSDTFESLALDIARFQFDMSPGFARLTAQKSESLSKLEDLPIVPTDAFRHCRVAVHPAALDSAVFQTSGTTGNQTGKHAVRDLSTKEELTLLQARTSLFSEYTRGIVVALAAPPQSPPISSLNHMMELFMRSFDGRALSPDPRGAPFDAHDSGRWLFDSHGVNVAALVRAARIAIHRSEPLFVLATSFALLATLEEIDGQELRMPSRTIIMVTGGFKGKEHTVNEQGLRDAAARTFQTTPDRIIGEYGMTELSSQLFEGKKRGHYLAPPWLRVTPVDPATYQPVPPGEAGLAHFIDLANVDSCLSIVTQDLIRETMDGYELVGRAQHAPHRGCSLPYESFLTSSRRPTKSGSYIS